MPLHQPTPQPSNPVRRGGEVSPEETGRIGDALRSLRGDPFVVGCTALASAALLAVALAPEMLRSTPAMRGVTSAFLAVSIFALWHGLARLTGELERRFWRKLIVAYGIWLATDLLMLAFSRGDMPLTVKVAVELGFAFYCVAMVYAVESHVHRRRSPDGVDRLNLLAIAFFILGLMIYYDVIPQRVRSQVLEAEPSSTWLFATVDVYVAWRFVQLIRATRTPRWRALYSILAAATSATAVGDVVGGFATQAEANVFYSLTAVLLILAARLKQLRWPPVEAAGAGELEDLTAPSWQAIVYALLFPAMHFLLYGAGFLEDSYRSARDVVVLLSIVVLGTIAIVQNHGLLRRRRTLEEERERMITELRAKSSELERFAYTVSHDLKSPLVTIQGFLGMLKKDLAGDDGQRVDSDIERISGAARKMGRFLDELLELSRAGRVVGEPQAVPLAELAHEAVRLVSGRLSAGGVAVEIAPDLPVIAGDRTRLLQVLQNLLDNAVKFMGPQPAPRIEISARPEGELAVCRVRDNGIGLDPRDHQKIFGLFGRLDAQGEGSGIGLALVQRILESHGGRIWIESEGSGRGSTFCFTLPRAGTGRVDEGSGG